MKSYFAKLAARATLPNASPIPSGAVPVADPFKNVSTEVTPAATENVSLSEGSKTQLSEAGRSQSTVNNDEIVQSQARGRDREVSFQSNSDARPLTPRTADAESRSDVSERVLQIRRPERETKQQSSVVKLEPVQEARIPVKQDDTLVTAASPATSAEPREASTSPRTDQTTDESTAEHTISLKKADEFMSALFARRTSLPAAESNREKEQPVAAVQPVATPESTRRLQPAAKPHQPLEPPPEQPSLVIGKLTVEVVPPPSPTVAPRREIVVLHGARNSRPAAIHSSQRFGLGQF